MVLEFVVGVELPSGGAGQRQRQPARHHLMFKNNHFTELCSGSKVGSYLRLVSLSLRLKDLLGPVTRVKKKVR